MRLGVVTLMLAVVLMAVGCFFAEPAMLDDVWGSSSSDVFVVGTSGTIVHYDGKEWREMTSGTTNFLGGVWGVSPSDVFAVGSFETILHYDGKEWSSITGWLTSEE